MSMGNREPPDADRLLELMDRWPESWAGLDEDKPVGRSLVAELRHFVVHLHRKGLSHRTVRRHLDNLWLIGGEIIREFSHDPELRRKPPRQLLLDAIMGGEAPPSRHATKAQQRSLDATARKLLRFLAG